MIPPSYVEMELREGEVWINEGVSVDEEDVVHIYSIEPEPPAPVEPIIEPLSVTANGVYTVPSGTDGYNPVDVNVPSIAPVIQSISITQNGTYIVPEGVDGFNPVIVDVSGGGSDPSLPSEYQEVEYIESTGTQYTTPMVLTIPLRSLIGVRFARMSDTNEQAAFGSHSDSALSSGTLEIGIASGASASGVSVWGSSQIWKAYEGGATGNPCSAIVNVTNALNSNYITLFKYKTYMLNGRLYACNIYKLKDTFEVNPYELLFKAVPCYRRADNEIGFYELVSGTFLTNAGTGTFSKGPDIN